MTITTKRLTLADVKELNEVSMFRPSELKNNWVKIYLPNEEANAWGMKGFYVEALGDAKCLHGSITNLSTLELKELGLAMYASEVGASIGASLMSLTQSVAVRDDLYLLKNTDFQILVIANDRKEIRDNITQVRDLINSNAQLWYRWLRDAEHRIHEGDDLYKFPNGLSVRFYKNQGTFANARLENGDDFDFANAHELYWWLRRYF